MWIEENNCVQCPDGCRSCGRRHQNIRVCDECGSRLPDQFFEYEGSDYCPDCAYNLFMDILLQYGFDDAKDMDVDEMATMLEADTVNGW